MQFGDWESQQNCGVGDVVGYRNVGSTLEFHQGLENDTMWVKCLHQECTNPRRLLFFFCGGRDICRTWIWNLLLCHLCLAHRIFRWLPDFWKNLWTPHVRYMYIKYRCGYSCLTTSCICLQSRNVAKCQCTLYCTVLAVGLLSRSGEMLFDKGSSYHICSELSVKLPAMLPHFHVLIVARFIIIRHNFHFFL